MEHNQEYRLIQSGATRAGFIVPHWIEKLQPVLFHHIVRDSTRVVFRNVPLIKNEDQSYHEIWIKLMINPYFVLHYRAIWRHRKLRSTKVPTSLKEWKLQAVNTCVRWLIFLTSTKCKDSWHASPVRSFSDRGGLYWVWYSVMLISTEERLS